MVSINHYHTHILYTPIYIYTPIIDINHLHLLHPYHSPAPRRLGTCWALEGASWAAQENPAAPILARLASKNNVFFGVIN